MKHRIAVGITAVAVAAGTTFIGIGNASAAAKPTAACKASGNSTTTPGLTGANANHTTKITGKLSGCTGSGGVKSASFSGSAKSPKPSGCGSLAAKGSVVGKGTETIKWNNGKTSTASITLTSQGGGLSGGNIIAHFGLTGKVTKGQFAGKALSGVFNGTVHLTGTGAPCTTTNPISKMTFTGSTKIA